MSTEEDTAGSATEAAPSAPRRRTVRLLLGVAGLLAVGYAALVLLAGTSVPRGATVEGVAIGGLAPAAAEDRLRAALEPRSRTPIAVAAAGRRTTVTPAAAGLAVDYAASVEKAGGGRSLTPAALWRHYLSDSDTEAVLAVDEAAMGRTVASLTESLGDPPADGGVRFVGGRAEPVAARPGQVVDPDEARAAIEDQFLHDGTAVVPLSAAPPEIDDAAVEEAMRTFATPAMSGPVTLELGGEQVEVPPRLFGRALSMTVEDGRLVPEVDAEKLAARLTEKLPSLGKEPRDATFRIIDGRARVVPARTAVRFDHDDLEEKLLAVVVQPADRRTTEVAAEVEKPELSTAAARQLGVKERVSTFTTYFPYAEYRNVNLTRAASLINGTLLEPGETFSLNGIVGERTEDNGFTEGYIIKDGLFRVELGGGVSQIATTTFNAMFFAGLEDVQHKPHSVYISRYPEGREATVAWPSVDLRFRNDTSHGVFVTASVRKAAPGGQGSATVSMWSTKTWDISSRKSARYAFTDPPTRYLDAPDCEASSGGPGFQVDVTRVFRRPGSVETVRTERFHTVYNPEPRLICGKKPADAP